MEYSEVHRAASLCSLVAVCVCVHKHVFVEGEASRKQLNRLWQELASPEGFPNYLERK